MTLTPTMATLWERRTPRCGIALGVQAERADLRQKYRCLEVHPALDDLVVADVVPGVSKPASPTAGGSW